VLKLLAAPTGKLTAVAALALGLLLAAPVAVRAQAPRIAPVAARLSGRPVPQSDSLKAPRADLFELGRYVGWGGAIGAGLGFAYGIAFERAPLKGIEVIADTVIGFTVGLVGGAAVYITIRARDRLSK